MSTDRTVVNKYKYREIHLSSQNKPCSLCTQDPCCRERNHIHSNIFKIGMSFTQSCFCLLSEIMRANKKMGEDFQI